MILISAGLVLAAVILLIAGFVLAKVYLIMWSIVASVLSALFLVIGAFLRRHELFPGGGQAAGPATPPAGLVPPGVAHGQTAPHAPTGPHATTGPQGRPPGQTGPAGAPQSRHPRAPQPTVTMPQTAPATAPRRPAARGISPDAIVLVIPGRKRYHVPGCRQLIGRDHEELTYEEAREEGFTPCTACLPDAALGGRQLPPGADPEPATDPELAGAEPAKTPASGPAKGPAASGTGPAASGTGPVGDSATEPAAKPKPGSPAPASGPEPDPATSGEDGSKGWFARPASLDTPSGDAAGSTSPGSSTSPRSLAADDETDPKLSPPPAPGARPAPARGGRPDRPQARPGDPAGERPEGSGKRPTPSKPAREGDGDETILNITPPAAASTGRPSGKHPEAGSPAGEGDGDETILNITPPAAASAARPSGKRPEAGAAGSPGRRPESGPTGSSGERPGGSSAKGAARPAASRTETPDDDDSGPATRPQRAVSASGEPVEPPVKPARPADGKPGSESAPRPAGARPASAQAGPRGDRPADGPTAPERPASAAESPAKARGPLPGGAAAAGKPVTGKPGSKDDMAGKDVPGKPGGGDETAGKSVTGKDETVGEGEAGSGRKGGAVGEERGGTVKVIVGTRRYHGTDCPLIQGAGDDGVETMTLAEAEDAGLTSCSVCQSDRETVA
ncbi:hypothetical protein ACGF0J_24490 [Nonomuraea sp. NPDC047897]|uniref:hypothetical protein n=1 Tax=Nonomuraea sp. NPDC047897 TaxID=3364346 RepID=UPI0037101544